MRHRPYLARPGVIAGQLDVPCERYATYLDVSFADSIHKEVDTSREGIIVLRYDGTCGYLAI